MLTKTRFYTVFTTLLLAACASSPPATQTPDLTYENLAPMPLAVREIQIVDNYHSPLAPPNVEHLFPVVPDVAITRMLQHGYTAAGTMDKLIITIEKAPVLKETLVKTEGFMDLFLNEPAEKLRSEAVIKVELLPEIKSTLSEGYADVRADRTATIMEDASPADRDRIYIELTETLTNDLKTALDSVIKTRLGALVIGR